MFAVIFHWWLGALLSLAGVGMLVAFVVGYIKMVVAPQHPGKRNKRDD